MRTIAAGFIALGVAGGVAVGVGQYQAATPDRTAAVSAPVPLPTARPTVVKVRVLPCEPGWTLKKGACVRVVEKRVVVPRPAVANRAPAQRDRVAPARAPRSPRPAQAEDRPDTVEHESDEAEHEDEYEHEDGHEEEHEDED